MPPDEIGSEFHWDPVFSPGGWLPEGNELYATGCGALSALLRRLAPRGRLHVPSFFCTGVAEALAADVPIAWYRHLPGGPSPETLRTHPGDVVLIQNLFGRDEPGPWRAWMRSHPGVTVIEDHSHDPFSVWARTSIAAYAVASLRKTLPLPDGGLLWSPRGLPLPGPQGPPSDGAALKLAAMLLKAAWLDGNPVPKDTFRFLQQRGERTLLGSAAPASDLTRSMLPLLDVTGLRAAATRNAHELTALLPSGAPWRTVRGGPPDAAPFRVQLICRTRTVRDSLLAHLARNGVYAPVHWRQDRSAFWSGDTEAADLGDRILTLPADQRCDTADIHRIADLVAGFLDISLPRELSDLVRHCDQ